MRPSFARTRRVHREFRDEAPLVCLPGICFVCTAVSGAELQERGATQIAAVADFAPNVNFSFGGTSSGSTAAAVMFIRGVGQNDFLPTTEPGVGLYVDGAYYGRTVGSL